MSGDMARTPDAFDLLVAAYDKGVTEGRWGSKSAFAEHLFVAQATASAWLHRRKKPLLRYALVLRDEFGIEPALWSNARIVRTSRAA